VADSYSAPYRGQVPDHRANFYGMITCIDDNMARLRAKLAALGIEHNTILIFMTDNGTSAGCTLDGEQFVTEGFNAGMRGVKGSEYDGGHRTPLFLRWPAAGLAEGRDVGQLTANVDVLPTLIDLCGLEPPEGVAFSGISLKPLLMGQTDGWPDRVVVTDSQRVDHPIKWRKSATMTQRWRLVNGIELYDIAADPEQRDDVAADHPEVVAELREHYEAWWELVSRRFDEYCPTIVGAEPGKVECLTTHDWHGEECAWNQGQIRKGVRCNGFWAIDVAAEGEYAFELRRWPREEARALTEGIPGEIRDWYTGGNALDLREARIQVGEHEETKPIDPEAKGVTFAVPLSAGETRLQTWLTDAEGTSVGAYYVYVRRLG